MPDKVAKAELPTQAELDEIENGWGRVTCEGINYGGCAKAIFKKDGPICADCVEAGFVPKSSTAVPATSGSVQEA